MAADIVKTSLEIDDKASAPLQTAEQAASEYAETTNGLTEAEKRLLAQMLATQKALEDRARVTGLSVSQIQALERGVKQQAAAAAEAAEETTRVADAQTAAAASADDAGKAMERASFGAKQLRFQLADIGVQLVGGMNPFVILAQQGPDVAYAFEAGGGAANTMRAAFGGLITQAGALAPILAGVALVVAAVGTAYAVTANHLESAVGPAEQINELLREQHSVAGTLSYEVENLAGKWQEFRDKAQEVADEIDRINTGMVNIERAREKAAGGVAGGEGFETLRNEGQRVAELRRLIQAEELGQAAGEGGFAGLKESQEQVAKYRAELERLEPVLAQHKAEFKAAQEQAANLAEYNAELANSEAVVAERTEKATEAKKAKAEADRKAAEWTKEAMWWNERYYAMLQRNLDAIREGEEAFYAVRSGASAADTAIARLTAKTDSLVPPYTGSRLEQLNSLLLEMETRAANSAEANAQLAEAIERVRDARDAEAATTAGTAGMGNQANQSMSGAAGAASALGAVAGGPAGIAAAAGPYGAAIMAAIGLVQGLSPKAGEVGLIDQAQVFIDDLLTSLAGLPAALVTQLADVDLSALSQQISTTLESLLVGLIEALPTLLPFILELFLRVQVGLLPAIIQAIPAVLTAVVEVFGNPDTWRDMAAAMLEALRSVLTDSFGGAAERISGGSANLLARLPGPRGGGGVNITLNGMVGDAREVVRTMRDRLGTLGSGLSFDRDGRWST